MGEVREEGLQTNEQTGMGVVLKQCTVHDMPKFATQWSSPGGKFCGLADVHSYTTQGLMLAKAIPAIYFMNGSQLQEQNTQQEGRLETRDVSTSKVFVSLIPVAYFALVIDFRSF